MNQPSGSVSMSTSSSLLDSSILGGSALDRHKALRPVRGRSVWEGLNEGKEGNADGSRHLLGKRLYPDPKNVANDTEPATSRQKSETKTELESAVLLDCLSGHFLWESLPPNELQRLCDSFEKCRYRTHEVIFGQGEEAQFVYILYQGEVARRVGGRERPLEEREGKYTILGELAVLTGSPYQESVSATSPCTLFRLNRITFHDALRPSPETSLEERLQLLKNAIPQELDACFGDVTLQKLVSDMTAHSFRASEVLVEEETRLDFLVIVAKGRVVASNISFGGRSYDDLYFGPGESKSSFGWQSVMGGSEEPAFQGTVVAESDGTALILNKKALRNALGGENALNLQHFAAKRLARIQLQQIPVFHDSSLEDIEIDALLDLMHRCEYPSCSQDEYERTTIFKAGEKVEAAMYFVREGAVTLELNKGATKRTVSAGGYFGEQNMLRDQNGDGRKPLLFRSTFTALAHGSTVVDILYLEECRSVVNTSLLGLGRSTAISATDASNQWADLDRHSLLGAGHFGQVWLASIPYGQQAQDGLSTEEKTPTNEPRRRVVALKVQAKHQLVQSGKAQRFVAERNILASLHSPFVLQLFSAFQDESRLYMTTSFHQGGELESVIPENGLSESAARFYAAGILEGLAYMHRRHIIHRDVKPVNVLVNDKGYPVLIDFGFAKYVPGKTYTFCGSPMLTAPEIIMYKGHDKGCDYWAWAVLLYRMVTGKYPFYEEGIDELTLYKRICRGKFELDGLMSIEFRMLMVVVLYPDPEQRLGSGVNGWRDIFDSPWFANDSSFDLRSLRKQDIPAPWVPDLIDPLDASKFHPDVSKVNDLMSESLPTISDEEQRIFSSFGPPISSTLNVNA